MTNNMTLNRMLRLVKRFLDSHKCTLVLRHFRCQRKNIYLFIPTVDYHSIQVSWLLMDVGRSTLKRSCCTTRYYSYLLPLLPKLSLLGSPLIAL